MRLVTEFSSCSSKGNIRQNNEDSVFLDGVVVQADSAECHLKSTDEWQIFAVCDGMGGQEKGEEASYEATRLLKDLKNDAPTSEIAIKPLIDNYILNANNGIRSISHDTGSTLALLCLYKNTAFISNLGDSRIYLFRDERFSMLTDDHSKVQRMVNLGMITNEQAANHPERNVIVRYLGMDDSLGNLQPSFYKTEVQIDDTFIICSDGITDMLTDYVLNELLRNNADVTADDIVNAALAAGGADNATAIIVRIGQEELTKAL